jgi:hypothetical protein
VALRRPGDLALLDEDHRPLRKLQLLAAERLDDNEAEAGERVDDDEQDRDGADDARDRADFFAGDLGERPAVPPQRRGQDQESPEWPAREKRRR